MGGQEVVAASHERVVVTAGYLSAALSVGGILAMGRLPPADASPEAASSHFLTHHDRILAGGSVLALGLVLTLGFMAGLAVILKAQCDSTLTTIGVVAGAARVVMMMTASLFLLAGAYRFGLGDPSLFRTLADAYSIGLLLSAYPTATSLVSFGLAMLRANFLPNWTGWVSLAAAGLHVIAASTFAQSGHWAPPSFIGTQLMPAIFYGWVLIVASALLLSKQRATR